jgi:hypothetical protein
LNPLNSHSKKKVKIPILKYDSGVRFTQQSFSGTVHVNKNEIIQQSPRLKNNLQSAGSFDSNKKDLTLSASPEINTDKKLG